MQNFTTYSFDYPNKNDEALDILALFIAETVIGIGLVSKDLPINRKEYGI